jgi:hypothetical protein
MTIIETDLERRPLVLHIIQLGIEREDLVPKWRLLFSIHKSVIETMKKIAIKRALIIAVQKGLGELREKIEVCPTCGSDKEYWKHELGK